MKNIKQKDFFVLETMADAEAMQTFLGGSGFAIEEGGVSVQVGEGSVFAMPSDAVVRYEGAIEVMHIGEFQDQFWVE